MKSVGGTGHSIYLSSGTGDSGQMEIEESDQKNGHVQNPYPAGAGSALIEDLEDLDTRIIQLLDSVDSYLNLYDSLTHAMRQGWLEIASARYSMGSSRISGALFSLKPCHAYTSIYVEHTDNVDATDKTSAHEETDIIITTSGETLSNCFSLNKWISLEDKKEVARAVEAGFKESQKRSTSQLRRRLFSHSSDKAKDETLIKPTSPGTGSNSTISQVEKRKSEALSLFGPLVSPPLRSAQLSFETALEILVEIANARNTMLSVFSQLSRHKQNRISQMD